MKFKIVKVDARYKAHPHFQFYVVPTEWPLVDYYLELREWCWATYGPGCDVDMRCAYNPPEATYTYKWVWQDEECRIFFKDSPEFAHFQLIWS